MKMESRVEKISNNGIILFVPKIAAFTEQILPVNKIQQTEADSQNGILCKKEKDS